MNTLAIERNKYFTILRQTSRRGFDKIADISGDQDTSFEQAFSNLAHSYLREKAPGLLDYEVGFQLVDKSDENDKAFGVVGFKVGKQWLYAPIFFIGGELKGHELLYIKNQDLIIPLTENWLNYILNRRPHTLGDSVPRDLARLGVLPPNFYQLSRSPNKYASINPIPSHFPDWVKGYLPDFAHQVKTNPYEKLSKSLDLPTFLKKAGKKGINAFLQICMDYPKIVEGVDKFYGKEKIAGVIGDAAKIFAVKKTIFDHRERDDLEKRLKKPKLRNTNSVLSKYDQGSKNELDSSTNQETEPGDVVPAKKGHVLGESLEHQPDVGRDEFGPSVRILRFSSSMLSGGVLPDSEEKLDAGEREKLLTGKVVIKDERFDDQVTIPYVIEEHINNTLVNPSESGLYDVLVRPFEFAKCAVFLGPYSSRKRSDAALVIRLSDKSWLMTNPIDIWTRNEKNYNRTDFDKWVDGLADVDSFDSHSGPYTVISLSHWQASVPFHVHKANGGEVPVYDVHFDTIAKKNRPSSFVYKTKEKDTIVTERPFPQTIVLTGQRGYSLRINGDSLFVPKGAKVLKLSSTMCGCGADSEPPPMLVLAAAPDIHTNFRKMPNVKEVDVKYSKDAYIVSGSNKLSEENAVVHLVKDHGLKEAAAREILQQVKEKDRSYFFKYAEPYYDLQRSGPGAPPMVEPTATSDPFVNSRASVLPTMEYSQPVPGLSSQLTDRYVYHPMDVGPYTNRVGPEPDPQAVQSAMQGVQSGQKEVFDTGLISSILKTTSLDSVLDDEAVGHIMKALDTYGRLLMHYYWNNDQWEDRFGKDELKEMESAIRDTFLQTGDLALSLREKKIDAGPEEGVIPNLKYMSGH